jgi:hypothetical protein
MSEITRHTSGNIGGVNPPMYVFPEDIDSITVNSDLTASVELKAGKAWNYLYGTNGTIQVESKEEPSPAGMKYIYQAELLIPKDRSDAELVLANMNDRGIIILAMNKNGQVRLFGDPDNPMRKSGKLTWPAETEGFNGTKLTLSGQFSHPAYYIDELDSMIPFQASESY